MFLSGSNSYTAGTSISGGVLEFANTAALPGSGSITINAGGALAATGAYGTAGAWLSERLDLHRFGRRAGPHRLGQHSDRHDRLQQPLSGLIGSNTYSGTLTPSSSSVGYLFTGANGTLTIASALTDDGGPTPLRVGPNGSLAGGLVILTGNNNDTGGTTISGGTLQLGGTGVLGTGNRNATTVTVNGGCINTTGGTLTTFNHNTGAGTSTIGSTTLVGTATINAGTVNFNSTQSNGAPSPHRRRPSTSAAWPRSPAPTSATPAAALANAPPTPLTITSTVQPAPAE